MLSLEALPALTEGAAATQARAAFGAACHQRPERSFVLFGRPLAACARCTGVHAAGLLAAVVGVPLAAGLGRRRRAVGVATAIAGGLLGADVLLGSVATWDHPVLRAALGGCAAGLALLWGAAALEAERDLACAGSPA